MQATFDGRELILGGTVGDPQLVEQVDQAAQLIYAPFVQSEIQVDPALDSPPWLAGAAQAIGLLQTISSGTLTVSEGTITVEGQAASAEDAANLETYLSATGLPVEVRAIEITDLRDAVYVIAGSDGQLALSGALPNEEIRMGLVEAGKALYGEENVFDASTVDPTVSPGLWMYTPGPLIATLATFPTFEVRLDAGTSAPR